MSKNNKTIKLRLTLDVDYEDTGNEVLHELVALLEDGVRAAIGNGLLSGGTPVLVDQWDTHTEERRSGSHLIDAQAERAAVVKCTDTLRQAGHAVAVWSPYDMPGKTQRERDEQLAGIKSALEDTVVLRGNELIEDLLGTSAEDDE